MYTGTSGLILMFRVTGPMSGGEPAARRCDGVPSHGGSPGWTAGALISCGGVLYGMCRVVGSAKITAAVTTATAAIHLTVCVRPYASSTAAAARIGARFA